MSYQADFLAIGKGACGDSFAVRFGDLDSGDPTKQTVILIDGGFTDDWKVIKDAIEKWYGDDRIDLVVSTHPDQDHINGLKGVLENMRVGELWMHMPWEHSDALKEFMQNGINSARFSNKIENSLNASQTLYDIALRTVPIIREPFAAETKFEGLDGSAIVVGPSKDYYESVLPQFIDWKPKERNFAQEAIQALSGAVNKALETFDIESLTDKGETSPQNNSSVVLLIQHDNQKLLFTGDAGKEALDLACAELEYLGHSSGSYNVVQVPHHGSRQNVGPTVLSRLLGEKLENDTDRRGSAYVSAAKECSDHPKKSVMNSFRRRGYPVFSTEGIHHVSSSGGSSRGWTNSIPHPLYSEVEIDE